MGASAVFRVTFDTEVTNVTTAAFALSTTGDVSGSIASVSAIDGRTYDVTVNQVSGTGALRLDLRAGSGVSGSPGAFVWGQTYMRGENLLSYGWGDGQYGQLGTGDLFTSSSPYPAPTTTAFGGKPLVALAVGHTHSLGLTSDGKVFAWGYGQGLGKGSSAMETTPVAVSTTGVLAGKTIIGIAVGNAHSLALSSDGEVFAWGADTSGQLGKGVRYSSLVPVAVTTSGVLEGKRIIAIATSHEHNLALSADGQVFSWGLGTAGELGDGKSSSVIYYYSAVPVAVSTSGALAGQTIVAITAGYEHSLALSSEGKVFAWGLNENGQLGDGTYTNRSAPVAVNSGALAGRTVRAIAAGSYHNVALDEEGLLFSWGSNARQALGNPAISGMSPLPVAVDTSKGLSSTTAVAISTGADHNLVISRDGRLFTWGSNDYRQSGVTTGIPTSFAGASEWAGGSLLALPENGSGNSSFVIVGAARKKQTITFASLANRRLDAGPAALLATASSGLPVTFSVLSGPAMVKDGTLVFTGLGTVTVLASQPGNDAYLAAADVTRSFVVSADTPRIVFADLVSAAGGQKVGDLVGYLPQTGGSGRLLFSIPSQSLYGSATFVLGADGSFAITATATASQTTLSIQGTWLNAKLTGSIPSLGLTYSANQLDSVGATSGWVGIYQGVQLGATSGSLVLVVGPQSQLMVVGSAGTSTFGGLGVASADGTFSGTLSNGQIAGSIERTTGKVDASFTPSTGTAATFAGLNGSFQMNDRLVNLSARAPVGSEDQILISGFYMAGTQSKSVLIRAVGPSLTQFGVSEVLANPQLSLYNDSGVLLTSNDDWDSSGSVGSTGTRVGAFSLPSGSKDAALLITLSPGAYTAQVSGVGGSGVALVEVYDASPLPSGESQRLINLSARGLSGPGEAVLSGGFAVTGNAPKKLLIRGVGPTLTKLGVNGAIPDPFLTVYRDQKPIAKNDNWGNLDSKSISAAAVQVGAFGLVAGSKDAAMILTLAAGSYTIEVNNLEKDTGVALIEIYEIPN